MMKIVKKRIMIFLFYIFRIFPISNRKIVVSSFAGKGYGAEGKAIIDVLLKKNKNFDIVWMCNNESEEFPNGVRSVKRTSIQSIYEQVTAHIWIDNRRKPGYVRKRKKQYYIQTWHGNVCIKHVEKDAGDLLSEEYIYNAKNDSKMADLFISGCEWRTRNYQEAFWYKGEIMKGDLYSAFGKSEYLSENEMDVRRTLRIEKHVNILLYAPTFRNDARLDCYNINYGRLINCLESKFGGKWCIVVRLHPNISELNTEIEYSSNVINGSLYPQINDLIYASKILISDYSGVIFDGFKSKKIVILYAADYKEYISKDRNLYFDFCDMPSPIAKDNEELMHIIEEFDCKKYEDDRVAYVNGFGYYSENAAEQVAERIDKIIENG